MSADVEAIHDGERNAVLNEIKDQAGELRGQDRVTVTCPCGGTGPLRRMFRCLYCEVWFCPSCARDHFGPEDYNDA